ncbi:hypothetical protein HY251_13530 [bacterium]|nr:hypothetical protein [bacterium]
MEKPREEDEEEEEEGFALVNEVMGGGRMDGDFDSTDNTDKEPDEGVEADEEERGPVCSRLGASRFLKATKGTGDGESAS